MNQPLLIRRALFVLMVAATPAILCGCSKKLTGTYTDHNGLIMQFNGSKVTVTAGGQTTESTYSISGDTVTITGPITKTIVLTINSDGSLSNPHGIMLTKQ